MRCKLLFSFVVVSLVGFSSFVGASSLSKVFKKVNPAVVVILTKERGYSSLKPGEAVTITKGGLGSGIVISEDGLVMTSAHVVQVADSVVVRFLDGTTAEAKIIGAAVRADVALLKLDYLPEKLVAAELGDSDDVNIGDEIFIIGAPYGIGHTLTVGYMSGRRRPETICKSLVPIEFLQTDAAINKGNSGGPMFNKNGKVVGIVSHILSQSGGSEGLGFAISINTAKELLLNQNSMWTGLEAYLVSGALARALNVPQEAGLLIQRVAIDSPGEKLGLRPGKIPVKVAGERILIGGDIVLEVQGIPISDDFRETCRISDKTRGKNRRGITDMKVLRGGEVVNLSISASSLLQE
jgi:S1-C subfamily serine protease